jgi:AcrR family transcriptional regulator
MDAADRGDTEREIMEATYVALAEHGYADLTIQAIADAFPKSKSLLYYHYDDKAAILRDFLDYLVDAFRAAFEFDDEAAPTETLEGLLDELLPREPNTERRNFRLAVLELLVHAPHDERYADRFADLHAAIHDGFAAVIEAGIDAEAFAPVDPDETATLLVAVASGGLTWAITVDPALGTQVREVLDTYLAAELYR